MAIKADYTVESLVKLFMFSTYLKRAAVREGKAANELLAQELEKYPYTRKAEIEVIFDFILSCSFKPDIFF